jgi:hypothetical protein
VHQQAASVWDRVLPAPQFKGELNSLPLTEPLVIAVALRDTPYAANLRSIAEAILRRDMHVFGETLVLPPEIDWNRDYKHGVSNPIRWFRRIPFLDFAVSGDHKYIWEINRHQHLIALGQDWVLFGERRAIDRIEADLVSWQEQNPFVRSMNWASALEVAFRALSWMWVLHLCGHALSGTTRELLATGLLQHGAAIRHNLSTYFAPNTHILGEGVALHALGIVLGRDSWRGQGDDIVNRQLVEQVEADDFHFERSTYYHVYALDMFLFHYLLAGRPAAYEPILIRMAKVLESLLDSERTIPVIGDDDGGRFFHPYGERNRFANATLATCAALFPAAGLSAQQADLSEQGVWWIGPVTVNEQPLPDTSEHWASSGLTVFRRGAARVTFDCGEMSRGGAGHSHADALALTLSLDGREILTDPGTFTYVSDPAARDWFRGTGAHSTVRLGGLDQADPVHPFLWANKPEVSRVAAEQWSATGRCSYRGWTHERSVDWTDERMLLIRDRVTGPALEQVWHSALPITPLDSHHFTIGPVEIFIDPQLRAEIRPAWRSPVFGTRVPSLMLHCGIDFPATNELVTRIILP